VFYVDARRCRGGGGPVRAASAAKVPNTACITGNPSKEQTRNATAPPEPRQLNSRSYSYYGANSGRLGAFLIPDSGDGREPIDHRAEASYAKTLGFIDAGEDRLADLVHLAAVIRMFKPGEKLAAIKPIRPYRQNRVHWSRTALSILRTENGRSRQGARQARPGGPWCPLVRANLQRSNARCMPFWNAWKGAVSFAPRVRRSGGASARRRRWNQRKREPPALKRRGA